MCTDKVGNIFENITDRTSVIIPVNSSIDITVNNEIVDRNTLHGQLIQKLGVASFHDMVEKQIQERRVYDCTGRPISEHLPRKLFAKSIRDMYPLGSYLKIENYVLLINTHFDDDGKPSFQGQHKGKFKAGGSELHYTNILYGLRNAIHSYHRGLTRVPLINSHFMIDGPNSDALQIRLRNQREKTLRNCLDKFAQNGYIIELWKRSEPPTSPTPFVTPRRLLS